MASITWLRESKLRKPGSTISDISSEITSDMNSDIISEIISEVHVHFWGETMELSICELYFLHIKVVFSLSQGTRCVHICNCHNVHYHTTI